MEHTDYKILKVPPEIVAAIINYIPSIRYETYSLNERCFVTRNTFEINKIEATPGGTLIHLLVYGKNKLKKLEDLKIFVHGLEKMKKERECEKKQKPPSQ